MARYVTFREFAAKLLAPTVLQGYWGARWVFGVSLVFDTLREWGIEAIKSGLLKSDTIPDDALAYIGRARMMERYAAETTAQYKERLKGAWDAWEKAGTVDGITSQLEAFGLSGITIYDNADWDWDSDPDNWSRFWVVITGHPWSRDGTWSASDAWGEGGGTW